jgi:hypothetical protein
MDLGFGLGAVKQLKKYDVWPVTKVLSHLQKSNVVSPQTLEYYKTQFFDLENGPSLVESLKTHPKNALLPVVFVGGLILFVLPNFTEINDNQACFAAKKCDLKAKNAFAALQQASLPDVHSPAIE